MTLIDAVKSGKRFRQGSLGSYKDFEDCGCMGFTKSELLATDWELEEKHITVSRVRIRNAADQASSFIIQYHGQPPNLQYIENIRQEWMTKFLIALGLGE